MAAVVSLFFYHGRRFQNSVIFETGFGKSGLKAAFPSKI
jgi:hypothetical protein